MVTEPRARPQLVLALSARGWPQVRIARALGMSRQRVHQILHRPREMTALSELTEGSRRLNELSERLRPQRERLRAMKISLREQRAKHLHWRYLKAHPKAKA